MEEFTTVEIIKDHVQFGFRLEGKLKRCDERVRHALHDVFFTQGVLHLEGLGLGRKVEGAESWARYDRYISSDEREHMHVVSSESAK
jgi:hypothetical protein